MSKPSKSSNSNIFNFATAGTGGVMGWIVVHPFNTVAVRLNLSSTASQVKPKFVSYLSNMIRTEGVLSLYSGLGAGILRQTFYATSRFGLFEVFRDELSKYRQTDIWSRLITGAISGGIAAFISCPAEVTLVRISNDATLPPESRRNYTGVFNAFKRILVEEGFAKFFSGSAPFVNRAILVGAVQVGTYDQFREIYAKTFEVKNELANVFYASMTSGLIYSIITMPLETTKNRMAFQRADPVTGILPYRTVLQSLTTIIQKEGLKQLWAGFAPYYLRCGGHSVVMFISIAWLRKTFSS